MASIFARQAFRALQRPPAARLSRTIHSTAPVLKKKKAAAAVNDDDIFADDLFDSEPVAVETNATEGAQESAKAEHVSRVKHLEPEERARVYNEWLTHLRQRVGRHPEVDQIPRKTSFNILLSLATTKEQMEDIVELIPKFIANKRELPASFPELFTRRCQELRCPDIALKVFGSYPIYNVNLTLPAARWLLHSLYLKHSFEDVLIAANLYSAYGLRPINEDLVSASLLAAACYKHKTPEGIQIAEALQPDINKMLNEIDLTHAPNPDVAREQKWAAWALRRVNLKRGQAGAFVPMEKLPLKVKLPTYTPPKPQAA